MKTKQKIFILLVILLASLGYFYSKGFLFEKKVAKADGAVENLDEIVARKSRLATASWGASLLENAANSYVWQPETLNYSDITTGSEVWRLTYAPNIIGGMTNDLAASHWTADGNRLIILSSRTSAGYQGFVNPPGWFTVKTNGSFLRPAFGSPKLSGADVQYVNPSTILPDVFYSGHDSDYTRNSATKTTLFKVVIGDTVITKTPLLVYPDLNVAQLKYPVGKKALSGDGRKLQVSYWGLYYPSTVYPESLKAIDVPSGYSEKINLDNFWGGCSSWPPAPGVSVWHESKVTGAVNGADGVWSLMMPEGCNGPFWKSKLAGAAGVPVHTQDRTPPYDWGGEIEPLHTSTDGKNQPTPWCEDGTEWDGINNCVASASNLDHATTDRWGRFLTSGGAPSLKYWDTRLHRYFSSTPALVKLGHHDWSGWTDYPTHSGYPNGNPYPPTYIAPDSGPTNPQSIWSTNYKTGDYSEIAATHARYNMTANPPYAANARPTQSPDGTKTMFNATFLMASDGNIQLFWTVAYNPYPPEIKSAAKISNNVRLTWDFNQGSNCSSDAGVTDRTTANPNLINPRTYATRGWPHETLDCPPSPREIKEFRVWSSDNNSTWTPLNTTVPYSNCSGNNECGMWSETSWNYDAAQPNNTTKYYAITSVEHSGLESKTLSNVWKVVTDNSGNITQQTQQTAYPNDPGAKSNFFTTSPDAPILTSANHKESPAVADGQYTLNWNAPTNKDLVRYYNIYAHDGSLPSATQQMRIASIPATSDYESDGNFSYIDWLGNTDGSTQYKITSVDFQGNESGVVDAVAPSAPSGLAVL